MPEATNLRTVERIRSFLRAQIVFNNRMSTIDCIIKNISPAGAKIALSNLLAVPTEFEIYVPQKGRSHRARLVWRDHESVGVEFTDVQPAGAAPAAEPPAAETEARLRELELLNAKLKARVSALSRRLADLGEDPALVA
jgi:hypothetical protein